MRYLMLVLLGTLLTACYTPEPQPISSLTLLDAYGQPLANAEVNITGTENSAPDAVSIQAVSELLVTDTDGNLVVNDLEPGVYEITVSIAGVSISMALEIYEESAVDDFSIIMPVSVDTDDNGVITAVDLTGQGLFLSITGSVHDDAGLVSDAQISISGGVETNGAVATSITEEDGSYQLIVNVSQDNSEAVKSGTLLIVADGYEPTSISLNSLLTFEGNIAVSGLNFALEDAVELAEVYYMENFEQVGSGVCGNWSETLVNSSDFGEGDLIDDVVLQANASSTPVLLWNSHTSGRLIYNQAYLDGLVKLASNDASEGLIVDPKSNAACWYGDDVAGSQGTGNFMGEPDNAANDDGASNGGQSLSANGAAIVSPQIDLSGVESPVSLSFDTWWEIESVNPNEFGFDIMSVEYTTDNGESWNTLARLNPFSDPVGGSGIDRAPIPYSNTGFNSAPLWLQQEPISLDALVGQVVQLRFAFRTQDELYNGFRGWMVDNVVITSMLGTFPLSDAEIPVDPEPPVDLEFSMTADIYPASSSLNAGSEYNFEAVVDWQGGDVETLILELETSDGTTYLLEEAGVADFNQGEGGDGYYYYDPAGDYTVTRSGGLAVILTAKNALGEVIFTQSKVYSAFDV
jgi:hypothetical protein